MTRDDIIRMARESDIDPHDMCEDPRIAENNLERFAVLVASAEREAWQERQAKRMHEGVVTEWTNWYPCRYRTIDEAKAEACDHIPYEWRPLYTTPPQPEQEPVAWMFEGIKFDGSKHGPHLVWKPEYMDAMSADMGAVAIPLYTTPPQRKPLTDEEEREAFEDYALRTICNPVELQRKRLSGYGSEELNYLWRGWKARAAHGIKE